MVMNNYYVRAIYVDNVIHVAVMFLGGNFPLSGISPPPQNLFGILSVTCPRLHWGNFGTQGHS